MYFYFPGGNDKNAVVFNKETEQVIAVLKGHTKKVTSVIYHPTEVNILMSSRYRRFLFTYAFIHAFGLLTIRFPTCCCQFPKLCGAVKHV